MDVTGALMGIVSVEPAGIDWNGEEYGGAGVDMEVALASLAGDGLTRGVPAVGCCWVDQTSLDDVTG